MAQQLEIFPTDASMRVRDRKGRFATQEKAMYDKAVEENKYLRLQVEKFKRAWLSAGELASIYHRELVKVKEEIKAIRQKASQL